MHGCRAHAAQSQMAQSLPTASLWSGTTTTAPSKRKCAMRRRREPSPPSCSTIFRTRWRTRPSQTRELVGARSAQMATMRSTLRVIMSMACVALPSGFVRVRGSGSWVLGASGFGSGLWKCSDPGHFQKRERRPSLSRWRWSPKKAGWWTPLQPISESAFLSENEPLGRIEQELEEWVDAERNHSSGSARILALLPVTAPPHPSPLSCLLPIPPPPPPSSLALAGWLPARFLSRADGRAPGATKWVGALSRCNEVGGGAFSLPRSLALALSRTDNK